MGPLGNNTQSGHSMLRRPHERERSARTVVDAPGQSLGLIQQLVV